jgi:hypothetical protein
VENTQSDWKKNMNKKKLFRKFQQKETDCTICELKKKNEKERILPKVSTKRERLWCEGEGESSIP